MLRARSRTGPLKRIVDVQRHGAFDDRHLECGHVVTVAKQTLHPMRSRCPKCSTTSKETAHGR